MVPKEPLRNIDELIKDTIANRQYETVRNTIKQFVINIARKYVDSEITNDSPADILQNKDKVIFNNSVGDISALDINNGNLKWIITTGDKNTLIKPYLFDMAL